MFKEEKQKNERPEYLKYDWYSSFSDHWEIFLDWSCRTVWSQGQIGLWFDEEGSW